MKKFTFTLERVKEWREKQLTLEEAQLQRLFSEKLAVEQRLVLLEQDAQESAALVTRKSIQANELQAADAFRRFVVAQRVAIAGQLAECDRRIAEQQGKLMEARRKAELLSRLKDKRRKAWNVELAREIETQAGEIFLAKWTGGRR